MILISHRGNINGENTDLENTKTYIESAINEGFDVEIDVWYIKNNFYLGHDEPKNKVDINYLRNNRFWCHAKNIEALISLKNGQVKNFFWHQNDDFTITSNGYFWTFPGKKLTKNSICLFPEKHNINEFNCAGICSDNIIKYKKIFA